MDDVYFIGIDIGTYESKGVLVDGNMNVVAQASAPHVMEVPKPGYAEHDAEKTWWSDFCEISNALIGKSGIEPKKIAAVGCSTIAPCCLPVDDEMRPLRKAILYGIDVRAEKEIRFLEDYYGADEIFMRYGMAVTSQSSAAKILWIKNNEPDIYAKTAKFVTGTSYLVAKLTGNYIIDRYTASIWTPMYNIARADWEDDLSLFCRRDQLADCIWTCDIAGTINEDATAQTGLAAGTPVIAGTSDASAEAFSVGVLRPGEMMIMYGSSIFIIYVVDRFLSDRRLWACPYMFPDTYALTAGMSAAGTLTRWYRDQFARDVAAAAAASGENAYGLLAEAAKDIPAGSEGLIVLPYLSGERTPIHDPNAKGVIFGLGLRHTREHIYNACLESIGYGIAQHFAIFDEIGVKPVKIVAAGGGTKNPKWLQIVSDVCGREQQTTEVEIGAAYGDALLAALGAGYFKSPADAAHAVKVNRIIKPDAKTHRVYERYLRNYTNLYLSTKDIMHNL